MAENDDYIIENINFSMEMENMPLTEDDKTRLRVCLSGNIDINDVLHETIKKHTKVADNP